MGVLPVCKSVHLMCAWCSQRSEESAGSLNKNYNCDMSCHRDAGGIEPGSSASATSALNY